MRVLHVSSELAPFAQSGGLADVVAGLPLAQAAGGADVAVIVPLYRGVAAQLAVANRVLGEPIALPLEVGPHRFDAALRIVDTGQLRFAFVDYPPLFDRDGGLYGPGGPSEFDDNPLRFAVLGRAAIAAGVPLFGGDPDVLHLHDWQTGLAAVYARAAGSRSAIVTTIHNLAYRGIFPKAVMDELGIPWSLFTTDKLEFYDQVSFLKAGLGLADAVTTVSPTYAREILTPERGEVLDAFLRDDIGHVHGIVNGIDTAAWDPAHDPALPAPYSRTQIAGKAKCRRALALEARLPHLADHEALIGVVSRMTDQKGLDLIADLAPELHSLGARLVVLGAGEPDLEARFRYLAETFHDHVSTTIGFDIGFAHRIYAGCDLFVMPSRFEPCGLGQLYAMRYGSIPIVHAVGGLRDTVIDLDHVALAPIIPGPRLNPGPSIPGLGAVAGQLSIDAPAPPPGAANGVVFEAATTDALRAAISRAIAVFRDPPAFATLRNAAMARDSSWTKSASEYIALYRELVAARRV
ncbi:MAG: glycogen synthase [Kofleriaceae bacterium]